MTKQQFSQAWNIAQSNKDLINVDDSVLYDCALPHFEPVFCTIEQVAKLLRWQCCQLNGGFDAHELNEMGKIAKKKFKILTQGRICSLN